MPRSPGSRPRAAASQVQFSGSSARGVAAGPGLSLADTTALVYVVRLENLSMWPLVERFPNVVRWYTTMSARPSFATAITEVAPEAIVEVSRAAGAAAWPEVGKVLSRWS